MRYALDIRDDRVLRQLLGRPYRTVLDADDRAKRMGMRALITGAGGSVGSELSRQIAALRPSSLVLLDVSEYALFRIEQELRETHPDIDLVPVLADVTRPGDLEAIVRAEAPEVVYHAAAYKHVSMMERDVVSALRANVLGSVYVARACRAVGARLVLISSDKAANARSVMGASKRMSELAVLSESSPADPVAIVRFGNILGSSGSVVELMIDRIRRGQALHVTDPEASRYFMTPAEAIGLVLKADGLARPGEILWLEMGEPVRILDLARRLLAIAGAAGLAEVPIEFTGLRPGEKLREELTVQGLELVATVERGVWIARQPAVDVALLERSLETAEQIVACRDAAAALKLLLEAVPEYRASAGAVEAARVPVPPAPRPQPAPRSVGRPSIPAAQATA